jgi:proline iminopeptidase
VLAALAASVAHAAPSPLSELTEKGQTFQAPGATIYVETLGKADGVPLVVVNGGPGFDHTYEHVTVAGATSAWDLLARQRKVVFYDQRGNGRSGALKPGQSCTLADQIDDLEAVRAHLGVDQLDLLGHSWGGFLAMAYAARHPEHIRHLILVGAAAPKWTETVNLFKDIFPEGQDRADSFAFADQLGDAQASVAGLREYFHWLFYSTAARDAFLAAVSDSIFNKAVNESIEHDAARFDLTPELAKFRFPTLVITGRYDINVAPSVAYKIHKAIRSSHFFVLEKSGHLPFVEEPEAFTRQIEGFIGAPK